MTYGQIYEEFLDKCNCKDNIEDYRPCVEMYGVPTISYAIVVWFKDKSKIIYISEKAKEYDEMLILGDESMDFYKNDAREYYKHKIQLLEIMLKEVKESLSNLESEENFLKIKEKFSWIDETEKEIAKKKEKYQI